MTDIMDLAALHAVVYAILSTPMPKGGPAERCRRVLDRLTGTVREQALLLQVVPLVC